MWSVGRRFADAEATKLFLGNRKCVSWSRRSNKTVNCSFQSLLFGTDAVNRSVYLTPVIAVYCRMYPPSEFFSAHSVFVNLAHLCDVTLKSWHGRLLSPKLITLEISNSVIVVLLKFSGPSEACSRCSAEQGRRF